MRYWQVCPLGPTGFGDSPYQCFSSFAGNPYLIDLIALQRAGLLTDQDLAPLRVIDDEKIDYGAVYSAKWPALFAAYENYDNATCDLPYGDFNEFKRRNKSWLEPYAQFMALKDHFQGRPWWLWDKSVRFFQDAHGSPILKKIAARIDAYEFFQYLFFGQWQEVPIM